MATITQRLAFLISANADGAIKAFEKTANSAEKQMGKATKSIDKLGVNLTKFGAMGLASAGTLGAGLAKLAQGAIDDQKAQALLADQLKKSANATDAQVKSVEKFIDTTQRATGVADDQLRPALQTLVRTTGDVTKAQNLLRISMDVAAATGKDLGAVSTAIARASTGTFTALTRLGIPIDENTKKSKDFDKVLGLLTDRFGGQAAVAAETYAGKMARAKIAISEAGEQLGSAFIPFVEKGATVTANAVNALSKFDSATGGAVGKVAAFGTVGLGAVSTLSLLSGQAIKMRDRFTTLTGSGENATRSLNNMGKAAAGLTAALGAVAVLEVANAVVNEMFDTTGQTTRALQQLNIALGNARTPAQNVVSAFQSLVSKEQNVRKFSDLWTDFGKEITLVGTKGSYDIESFDSAFKKLLQSSPQQARLLIDVLKVQNKELDTSSQRYKDNIMLIGRFQQELDSTVGAQDAVTNSYERANQALAEQKNLYQNFSKVILDIKWKNIQDTYDKLVEKQKAIAEANKEAARKAEEFKQSILQQASALQDKLNTALDAAKSKLKAAKDEYAAYAQSVSGAVTGVLSLAGAQQQADENTKNVASTYKDMTEAQVAYNKAVADGDPEKTAEALGVLTEKQKAYNDALKQPRDYMKIFEDQAKSAEGFAGNIQKLLDLGANQTVIDQLVAAGADTGGKIAESILSSSDPQGQVDKLKGLFKSTQDVADKLGANAADKFKANGVVLAQNLVNGMNDVLSKAEIKLQWKSLNKNKKPKGAISSLTDLLGSEITGLFTVAGVTGEDVPKLAGGGIVKASSGGTLAMLGEGGRDEAVIPLPAAGGLGTTINVNVSAGMGADGTEIGRSIVDALVAYQRRVGALPIKVG